MGASLLSSRPVLFVFDYAMLVLTLFVLGISTLMLTHHAVRLGAGV